MSNSNFILTNKKNELIFRCRIDNPAYLELTFESNTTDKTVKFFSDNRISIAQLSRCPSSKIKILLSIFDDCSPQLRLDLWAQIKVQYILGGISQSGLKALTRGFGYKVKFDKKKKEENKRSKGWEENRQRQQRERRQQQQKRTYRAPPPSRKSPWDVLGVAPGASASEIKKAYRTMAFEHHPDRNGGSAESEAKFKEINDAYQRVK